MNDSAEKQNGYIVAIGNNITIYHCNGFLPVT